MGLKRLVSFYKKEDFTPENVERELTSIADQAMSLIEGQKKIVKGAALTASAAAVAGTAATNAAPYGYTTAAQADAIVTLVNNLRVRVDELESRLRSQGLLS